MSFIAGGAIGAIIAIFLTKGFTGIKETVNPKTGNTIITALSPTDQKPVSVELKNNAIVSPQFDFVRVTTSQTLKNSASPIYKLNNESGNIKRIFTIAIVPDATFQTEALMEIHLNGVKFFPITDQVQGQFSDVSAINVPIPDTYGLKILPKDKLEFFVWNPSGNPVTASIAVFIGELP